MMIQLIGPYYVLIPAYQSSRVKFNSLPPNFEVIFMHV